MSCMLPGMHAYDAWVGSYCRMPVPVLNADGYAALASLKAYLLAVSRVYLDKSTDATNEQQSYYTACNTLALVRCEWLCEC